MRHDYSAIFQTLYPIPYTYLFFQGEFTENGTETHFMIDTQPAVIRAVTSGKRREGIIYSLFIGDTQVPDAMEEASWNNIRYREICQDFHQTKSIMNDVFLTFYGLQACRKNKFYADYNTGFVHFFQFKLAGLLSCTSNLIPSIWMFQSLKLRKQQKWMRSYLFEDCLIFLLRSGSSRRFLISIWLVDK